MEAEEVLPIIVMVVAQAAAEVQAELLGQTEQLMVQLVRHYQATQVKFHRTNKMAITFKAKRIDGNQFTNEDLLETQFTYLEEVGRMYECIVTIEQVSGVEVTHGGGAEAGSYLHYKIVEEDGDEDGYIDYSTMKVQVRQEEKGESVIKVVARYITLAEQTKYLSDYNAWSDAYVTQTVLKSGEFEMEVASGAPPEPTRGYTVIKTGEIALKWADDTFV